MAAKSVTLKPLKKGGSKFHISNFKKPNTCPRITANSWNVCVLMVKSIDGL